MASSVIGALRVVLGLDSAEFETGIRRASRANKTFEKSTFEVSSAVRGMAAALGIVSVGAAARGFLSLADQSKQLAAQLKLATKESGSFAQAQADVRRIAAETRTDLSSTADLYATFQRNARELGITQEESARATETITKAFKISGATAAEAAGGLRQFLQGIQSGTLRGEELNSVLENAPRLAKALADGLGVTIGELRALGAAGKLTGREVLDALAGAADGIDREFAELPKTFDEAMTTLHNAAVITFGGFDRGGQFSTALANFITQGTGGFGDLEDRAVEFGVTARSTIEGLATAFDPMFDAGERLFRFLENGMGNLSFSVERELQDIDRFTGWLSKQGIGGALLTGNSVSDWWNETTSGTNVVGDYRRGQQGAERDLRRHAGLTPVSRALGLLSEANGHAAAGPAIASPPATSGSRKGGGRSRSAESLRREAEREMQRAADSLRRFLDDLAQSEADLVSSTAELSRDLTQRAEAEKGQIEVSRASRERSIRADADLDDAKKQQLLTLNDQEAANRKALVEQRLRDDLAREASRIIQDRTDLEIELLSYSRDLARTASERRDVELRILDLAFDAERARLEGIKATNAVTSAEYRYAEERLANLPRMQAGAAAVARERTQGPLEKYLSSLPRTADEVNEALESVATGGIQSIIDGLGEAAAGARSLGSVFKNVAQQIIADLIRIQIRKAIVSGLSSVLKIGGTPGLGKAAAGTLEANFDSTFASRIPKFATGGSFRVGGPPGIDNTLVAFKASRGEMVDIRRPGNDTGGATVTVVPSPYFDAVVDGRAAKVAHATGAAAAIAGGSLGEQRVMARSRRRIPG